MNRFTTLLILSVLALLALTGCSLAADVTPPPGYRPQDVAAEVPAATEPIQAPAATVPATPSDLAPAVELTPAAEEPVAAEGTIRITGQVTNASGAEIPPNMEVTLHGFDAMQETFAATTTADASGRYVFDDVETAPGRVFLTTVEYNGMTFNSDIAHQPTSGEPVALPLVIYETTQDVSSLMVDRMHVFFDFSEPESVQVVEMLIISNLGDRTVVPAGENQPALVIPVPEGATDLQFQSGELGGRFVETETGFGEMAPIQPGIGQHQVLYAYKLPFKQKIDLDLALPVPVQAAVVMAQSSDVQVNSSQLEPSGERDVEGMTFNVYSGSNLEANQSLQLTLARSFKLPFNVGNELLIGVAVFGLALVGAGVWLYVNRTRRGTEDEIEEAEVEPENAAEDGTPDDPDTLIDMIVGLDDLYRSGQLPEAAYHQRRAELKARLKDRME